jgi:hypothetical protein
MEEDIRNGKYEKSPSENKDLEWEDEPEIIVDKEVILKRKYMNLNSKE